MRRLTKLTGGFAAIALVAVSAAPASARGWGPPQRHHHHRDNGGDVVGTIAAVGIAALIVGAIASSNARKREEQERRRYDPPPPAPRSDQRYEDKTGYDGRADSWREDAALGASSQDEAVDACALAARDRATVEAGFGEVREIGSVRPLGNGWDVTGTLVVRPNVRATGQLRDFRCAFQDGRVNAVSLN
jgi:hypothetical protein